VTKLSIHKSLPYKKLSDDRKIEICSEICLGCLKKDENLTEIENRIDNGPALSVFIKDNLFFNQEKFVNKLCPDCLKLFKISWCFFDA
jgi:hypothetical protein